MRDNATSAALPLIAPRTGDHADRLVADRLPVWVRFGRCLDGTLLIKHGDAAHGGTRRAMGVHHVPPVYAKLLLSTLSGRWSRLIEGGKIERYKPFPLEPQ